MSHGLLRLLVFNLLRRPGRSVAAALGVLLAAGTLFAGGLISLGVGRALDTGLDRLGADLMVVPKEAAAATHKALVVGEPVAFYMDGSMAAKVAAVPGVQSVSPQIYVETLASSACCTGRLFLVGFDPATDMTVQPWLAAALGRNLGPNEILVGNHVLVLPGDMMKFYGTDFMVVDRLDPTGMGMDETVFLPASTVWAMAKDSAAKAEKPLTIPEGGVSSLMVKLQDRGQVQQVAARIEAALPGVAVVTSGTVTRGVSEDLAGLMAWLLPIAAGVLLVALLLFVMLFASIAVERSREIGLLRAMGATARQALTALVGEAVLLGAAGGLLGVVAGWVVYGLFQKAILVSYVLPFLWPPLGEELLLAVAVVIGGGALAGLAAWVPAWRMARLEPHYAIHGVTGHGA